MSLSALAITFGLVGAACELGGLATVALGFRRNRQRSRDLLDRPPPPPTPHRFYPSHPWPGGPRNPPVTYGSEHRQREALKRLDREIDSLTNALIGLKKSIDKERDQLGEAVYGEIAASAGELRNTLKATLSGHPSEWIGVGLLMLGVLLTVAGSVLGVLA